MGNCLVVHDQKTIRVMKTDGKILEYTSPLKVHQVLSQFYNHAISDELPVVKHLHSEADMLGGHLYYLLPLPTVTPKQVMKKTKKKTVRFADEVTFDKQEEKRASSDSSNVVRIKLVISKQELQAMLEKEMVSIEDIKCHVMSRESCKLGSSEGDECYNKRLFSSLESVPEVN